jgi:hypothetical protein
MTGRTKQLLLAGLLLAWSGLVLMQVLGQQEPKRAPLTHKSGQVAAAGSRPASRNGEVRGAPDEGPPPRNIFAPLASTSTGTTRTPARARPGSARPAHAPAPAPGASSATQAAAPPPSPAELAARQAQQRLATYRFLGYITERGAHRVFLGKGTELFVVGIGEPVESRIRLSAMDATAVTLLDEETHVSLSIPLTSRASTAGGPDGSALPTSPPTPTEPSAPLPPSPAVPASEAQPAVGGSQG